MSAEAPASDVGLEVELDRRINFAMQQNDVPVVKALRIANRSSAPLRDLEIRISSEPAFAQPWSTRIAVIGEASTYNVNAVDLVLSPAYLGDLTERVRGQLRIEVVCGDEILHRSSEPIELLARDEWSGLSSLHEILAAFVLPNHPALEPVLTSAAELMAQWTQDPSLNGYQSKDSRRVYTMAAAMYEALRKRGLTYINPPASFEDQGQRVRLPDRVFESGMATCLDMALVAAASLEQMGLHSLVLLVEGHAFTGVWLQEESFPEAAMADGLRLRKRVDLGEIAVFDPTGVTARPALSFENAVAEAKRRLVTPEAFLCAIDVARARKGRVRPLPERVERQQSQREEGADGAGSTGEPQMPNVPNLPSQTGADPGDSKTSTETPATRLDRWRRKLLDLSLRNRLLNFKDSKKTIPLLCPDLPQLEDMLASGAIFQIKDRPRDLGAADPRDPEAHRRRTGQEGVDALLREELKARRLHADTTAEELDRRLVAIYRAARLGLEEGGASALYLAVGFLAWYETSTSTDRRLAPILLIPLELHRKSILEGFSLRQSDDEPRINVTLLELLKQDHRLEIPGLDPLPEDAAGLDVPLILRKVREAIRDVDRWDVVDELRIGVFSFTKFLMWRDLSVRVGDLMKNAVVDHLVNRPDQVFDAGGPFPDADRMDEHRSPNETFCPLPADSSQLRAVIAAAEGRSFVIEGPPGTGKSQTITNLIAHCLTEGKTILFVSEKMAALNVVKRRLEASGLGRYCLELHSNKAHKREVVAQLDAALQHAERHDEEAWSREARRLAGLRNDLNTYATALHQKRSSGETVFQATSRLIGLRHAARVDLRWDSPNELDADRLSDLRDLVDRLKTACSTCGDVSAHPWAPVRREEWAIGWEEDVNRALTSLGQKTAVLQESARPCAERLGLGDSGWSLDALDLLRELTLALMDSPAPPMALLTDPDWEDIQIRVSAWIEHGRVRDRLRSKVREGFRDEITALELDDLQKRFKEAAASWWPASWWRLRPVRSALRGVAVDSKPPLKEQLAETLTRARALRDKQRALDEASDQARALLGRHWNGGEAEWNGVAALRDWARGLRNLALRAAGDDFQRAAALREQWARLASEGRQLLGPSAAIGREFVAYGAALDAFKAARTPVLDLLAIDAEKTWGSSDALDALGRVRSSVITWQGATRQLRDWCAWRRARSEAMRSNLAPLVEEIERGELPADQIRTVFERSYAQWWLAAVADPEPVLSRFSSPEHERKILQFRESDDQYMKLTRSVIQTRLAAKVPAASTASLGNSEMGLLKREVGKRRNHLPVRQLLQKIPNLLPRLKPCLLMSPISVAQYLDAGFPPFDIVVFDEASQIPVWDAIGAIARGRQSVIVGDPKQLPPTSFFQRAEDDDEENTSEDVVEDLESILDDCISAQIPWLPLNWHYRSRHESLITFSNYHYYGNRLLTFPAAAIEGLGVSWRHVPNGVYDKGKSRTNRPEAEAVVGEIRRRLRDPKLSAFSVGVVTFSQAQQTLIENLLDQARIEDPRLDPFFAEGIEEPVFVKNLENVQGDERDVILFSICYGPDAQGRVSMNFGPMNRDGGERRLNVAITRARREVIVFSTLTADQIDLARSRARGVKDLKSFLAYAERGPAAIAEATQLDENADFDSPFEEEVYDALARRGWEVHKQVGCARYRIDLAVIDPEARGRYLLGIECDGANYHRAKTARDRDKLREGILRDLGWKLHRIWSTDWWTDPDRELAKVQAALESAQSARSTPPAVEEVPQPALGNAPIAEPATKPILLPPAPEHVLERYKPFVVRQIDGSQSDFYEPSADRRIRDKIVEVVVQEGPISLALAAKRVATSWGFERVRQPVIDRIRRLVSYNKVTIQSTNGGEFLWRFDTNPDEYTAFRVPSDDGSGMRAAEDLPLEEIANAALYIVRAHVAAPADDIVREVARLFAFQRTGRVVDERVRLGLDLLVASDRVSRSGEQIAICESPAPT